MSNSEAKKARLERYLRRHPITLHGMLGQGKDGDVWRTNRQTALKSHDRPESYLAERNAYIRLRDLRIDDIGGFAIPVLRHHDDELWIIEIDIVTPPFIVDFASARLDTPSDLLEDEGHTLADMVRDRFDEHADEVLGLHYQLILTAGIYLSDFHRENIKFPKQ